MKNHFFILQYFICGLIDLSSASKHLNLVAVYFYNEARDTQDHCQKINILHLTHLQQTVCGYLKTFSASSIIRVSRINHYAVKCHSPLLYIWCKYTCAVCCEKEVSFLAFSFFFLKMYLMMKITSYKCIKLVV